MKTITFYKIEGAGNDFVLIDNREYDFPMDEIIRFTPTLCNRKFGIGADGLLVLQSSQIKKAAYSMIYRNADGSDAGMCGNGGRCMALFASKNGYGNQHTFNVHDKIYHAEISDSEVSIHFPVQVSPSSIELDGKQLIKADTATEHIVLFVDKDELENEKELINIGRKFRNHEKMNPPGTNVNFVCFENDHQLSVQTYERGVENLTLACGTGALASAIAAHTKSNSKETHADFDIQMKGGMLKASFDFSLSTNTYTNLILTGPAHFVFEGTISV